MAIKALSVILVFFITIQIAFAGEWESDKRNGLVKKLIERKLESQKQSRKKGSSEKGFYKKGTGKSHEDRYQSRDVIVYTPRKLPPNGSIPLLIVLHGGFGNAKHIQNYIGLDPLADKGGFIVAYLNGTRVAPNLPAKMQGWNAGGCCGLPQRKNIDDISFVSDVIRALERRYGVDPKQVYGTGHSNGGMMTQRILCETDIYQSGVSISGTLQLDVSRCPAAKGKNLMNIHGAQDENLPIKGGHTVKGFNKKTDYKSQEYAQEVFERSDAAYDLVLLEGADHSPESLNAALWATENMSLPQKIVQELGLD